MATCIDNIPHEILTKIFSFCSIGELFNVVQVCLRFRNCVDVKWLWRKKLLELTDWSKDKSLLHFCLTSENQKEACRKFCLVFGMSIPVNMRCSRCQQWCCELDCINDREEMIIFDFGSKTTWFKYCSDCTGQLSMHPTVGPIVIATAESHVCETALVADQLCPICARMFKSCPPVHPSLGDVATSEPESSSSNRISKAFSKLSLRGLYCFGASASEDMDEGMTLVPGDFTQNLKPEDGQTNSDKTLELGQTFHQTEQLNTYKFLIKHMLKRNPFFQVQHIPFVICEPIKCDDQVKQTLAEFLLVNVKAPAICFVPKPLSVALYMALDTCLVIDSGANNTVVTPVIDHKVVELATVHKPLGGAHLTRQIVGCLQMKGLDMEIKESNIDSSQVKRDFYLAYNAQSESRKNISAKEVFIKGLKDNRLKLGSVRLSHELYQLSEDMYLHLDLPQMILDAVASLDRARVRCLLSNIILTGGNCRLNGLAVRLTNDLQLVLPQDVGACIHVIDPRLMTGRSDSVIGASYIKRLQNVHWITRRQFVSDALDVSN